MFTKTDCLTLLFELKDKGIDVDKEIKYLLVHNEPTVSIITSINSHMNLNLHKFYEKLRKSYNDGRSKLYINIVKENSLEPREVLCTLASLQLQILLFYKTLEDPMFLRHARFNEICDCLKAYYAKGDIIPCQELLSLFKADLKLLEENTNEQQNS